MLEITCGNGARWKILLVTEAGGHAGIVDGDARAALGELRGEEPAIVMLRCSTCEGPEQHVIIRARANVWANMPSAELCRLIAEAQ